MQSQVGITSVIAVATALAFIISCSDNTNRVQNEHDYELTDTVNTPTFDHSRDSLMNDFEYEIEKLESEIDSLDEKIKAVGGNVDETIVHSKEKLIAYKESLEDQTDKLAAATEDNWEKVKKEAKEELRDFKSNVAATENDIEEYFNNRTK